MSAPSGSVPVSGTQHVLRAGRYAAAIASVGASLRALTCDGRDLVVPFAADEVRPAYRGTTLAPWPNRVVDGRYVFDGVEYELALTEPRRGQALHGLLSWADFVPVDKGPSHVTLTATIEPQTGYPWRLVVETTYALGADGLTQSVRAFNDSASRAPWGTGPHPYLKAGGGTVDDWTLSLPAAQVLEVTPDRLSPTVLAPVETGAERFDFRAPRPIGGVRIDHAYTALSPSADGEMRVALTAASGAGVELVWGQECAWVQIHTADQPDGAASGIHCVGLAVEPMTCAPDAFNAERYPFDAGRQVIEAGEWSTSASWRIGAIG